MTRLFKINGLPKDSVFNNLIFGRQIDGLRAIELWKSGAQSIYVSIKRVQNSKSEIKKCVKMSGAKEFYCKYYDDSEWRDDSVELFYKI